MIRIKGLHKFFNKGKQNEIHVINNIDLDLPESGMVAIFGKSGCGKTTLLNVIGGLDGFAEGSVAVENFDIRQDTDTVRNKYIGYIFQNYNLNNNESCFDNVADALRLCGICDEEVISARVMAALANVGMDKYAKRTPDTLSGGQQQRIAIARAIVKNPKIILADEPTGNLDEANTVMIMDLLSAIAKDHLVLLVTHEANLVDYYCDKVIELSDGSVVSVRDNESADGYTARDKNSIYLGELEKREISENGVQAEFYGESPEIPVKFKIINKDGKIYIKLDTEKVQILDDFSEIKLHDGVFEEKEHKEKRQAIVDMSLLPPITGTEYGKLFGLKNSVVSGYLSNFKKGKKGKKLLRRCLSLFAMVIVFMTAGCGTSIKAIIDAKNAYNHNVFYVYTVDSQISQKIANAVGDGESGIDYIRLSGNHESGDSQINFRTGSFESFMDYSMSSDLSTNAVFMDVSLVKDMELVAGKKDDLENRDIVITTKVADALLEKSTLGYIKERDDLLGLISLAFTIDGMSPRIAGIVESDESAIYLTEIAMAKYVRFSLAPSLTTLASDYGIEVNEGETVLAVQSLRNDITYPAVGETVVIQGRELVVKSVLTATYMYSQWLTNSGIEKLGENEYFAEILRREYPLIDEKSAEYAELLENTVAKRHFEYYDYYYSEIDGFLGNVLLFNSGDIDAWLYMNKGIELAKFAFVEQEYYKAWAYRERYGEYPTVEQLALNEGEFPNVSEELKGYYVMYESEFYNDMNYNYIDLNTYMLSDKDFIAMTKQLGASHPSAITAYADASEWKDVAYNNPEVLSKTVSADVDVMYSSICYTIIHSNDPDATERWINENLGEIETPNEYLSAILTPDDVFGNIIYQKAVEIMASLITLGAMLVLMSVCMYFIMRSSLMVRIREIGIFRAIGVSKKNLIFKFLIESAVIATLTVFVGYLLSSVFIFMVLGMSSSATSLFFYPVPVAFAVLLVLYAISLFFGILPILILLRRTPSEILAKYDI